MVSSNCRTALTHVLCAALVLGIAACSATPAKQSKLAARTSVPVADPLAGMSVATIATKAFADFKAASSFRMVGGNYQMAYVRGKGCSGVIPVSPSSGSLSFLLLGSVVWVKASAAFWESQGAKAALISDSGKYLEFPMSGDKKQFGQLDTFCSDEPKLPLSELGELAIPASPNVTSEPGPYPTVDGQRTVAVLFVNSGDTALISDSKTPEMLRITDPDSSDNSFTITGYNSTTITVPPPADVLVASNQSS
jgi:hypothetical protein